MLNVLIGKTIESIEYFETDSYGDQEHVESHMILHFTDDTYAVISTGDPCCSERFYATLEVGEVGDLKEDQVISDSIVKAGPPVDIWRPWKYAGE